MISRVSIGAAAVAVALVAGACNRHGGQPRQRKATDDPTFAQDVERPVLTIAAREHDFGEVLRGDELRHTFDVANLGRFPLHLHFDVGSVCSTGTDQRRLEPGQRGRVDVVCRPAMMVVLMWPLLGRVKHAA